MANKSGEKIDGELSAETSSSQSANPEASQIDLAKKAAGDMAAAQVKSGMVVGLGTGSTANYFILALGRRVREEGLKIETVSSSHSSATLAIEQGLSLRSMEYYSKLDIYCDGADEVSPDKQLIKGRGAAMFREKLLASASQHFVVLVDEQKLVTELGTKFPVPVEVIPLASRFIQQELESMGARCSLRQAVKKDGPVITDLGNLVLDSHFNGTKDWFAINERLNQLPGVVGHGLFLNLAHQVLIGDQFGKVREL